MLFIFFFFWLFSLVVNESQLKQVVQGLQAIALCVVTVNDEHATPRLKRKLMG